MHAVRRSMKEEAAITLLHGFCSRLSTASLNHPPFTFYNARGLRIVKCPLRMKRTSSFVCDCVLEEQSLSVLSLSAKTRHSVLIFVECVVCSFVCVSSMLIVCSIRCAAAIDLFVCSIRCAAAIDLFVCSIRFVAAIDSFGLLSIRFAAAIDYVRMFH